MAFNSADIERIDRFFKGNYSEEDRAYLRKIFCDESKEKELEHILRKQWYDVLRSGDFEDKNLDHILHRIHYELNTKGDGSISRKSFGNVVKWFSRVAAILILPLLIYSGLQLYRNNIDKGNLTWVEIKAPAWSRVQFSLPDGSTGWLNSGSGIRYRSDFKKERKITLDGEAFFDIRKDTEHPLVVSANEINVTVLGTKFNIASYKDEKEIEVVLEEGKLELNNKEMTSSFTMNPNDLVIYDKTAGSIRTEVVQPQKYMAWTDGKLVFRNDPIDVIARRLGRWYNVDVEIIGNNFKDIRLRATFVDENLEEVLYYLKRALPLDYKIISGGLGDDDETYAKKKIVFTTKKR